jgi:hypothetical protein
MNGFSTGPATAKSGGSGVVIIRVPTGFPDAVHSATSVTTSGSYRIYTFNSSGSIAWI